MMESLYFAVAEFIKRDTPTQVFSCEYCELFINTFFEEHLRTAASNHFVAEWRHQCR